jgi:hypothetical protein
MPKTLREIRERLAQPYVTASVRANTAVLAKQFHDTHKLNAARIENRIRALVYNKPWPDGVAPDDAFNLAIHEALIIIREEMR